jgi:hypothetical protein
VQLRELVGAISAEVYKEQPNLDRRGGLVHESDITAVGLSDFAPTIEVQTFRIAPPAPRSALNLNAGGYLADPPASNLRSVARSFTAPLAPDAFGALLGGIAMTIGRTPKD